MFTGLLIMTAGCGTVKPEFKARTVVYSKGNSVKDFNHCLKYMHKVTLVSLESFY